MKYSNLSNKKLGTMFEKEFCTIASQYGFWAHRMQDNTNGQPADVILCKNDIPILVDCKVCENNVFPLSRIEENQWNAMTMWHNKGNRYAYFALRTEDEIRMISFLTLKDYKENGFKQLDYNQIVSASKPFRLWKEMFLMANEIRFVARIENEGNSMEVSKIVNYPDATPDKVIDRDYKDWLDSVNKGYWEEV